MAAYTFPTVPGSYVVGDTIQFNTSGGGWTFATLNTNTVKIELWGASGGTGEGSSPGGKGGYTYGTYAASNGTTLYINAGGLGASAASNAALNTQPAAAFNGGGQVPFRNGANTTSWGNGGGGATDVRLGGTALANRILIAGGGGGGGQRNVQITGFAPGGAGGGGGFMSRNGNPGYTASGRTPGLGGTQSAGGAAGQFFYDFGTSTGTDGTAGSLGQGGQAGSPTSGYYDYATTAGSGGGGYYGGGGGSCGGYDGRGGSAGGGGSGYINPTYITKFGGESGINTGSGYAIITILS